MGRKHGCMQNRRLISVQQFKQKGRYNLFYTPQNPTEQIFPVCSQLWCLTRAKVEFGLVWRHREKRRKRPPYYLLFGKEVGVQADIKTVVFKTLAIASRFLWCQHWHWLILGWEGSVGQPGYHSRRTRFAASPLLFPLSAAPSPPVPLQPRLCRAMLQSPSEQGRDMQASPSSPTVLVGWLRDGGAHFCQGLITLECLTVPTKSRTKCHCPNQIQKSCLVLIHNTARLPWEVLEAPNPTHG